MTYLLHRDRQGRARGNLLDVRLGLGVVHDRVAGHFLVVLGRFLAGRVRNLQTRFRSELKRARVHPTRAC